MNIEELKALEARATKGPWIDHGGRVGVEVEGTGTLPDGSPYPTRDLAGPVADAGDNDRPLTVADMLRLADVCERDGYVSNLGTNIRRAFTPAPAPDAALPGGCVLGMGTARSDDEHGYLVHSASGKWWWDIEGKKWKKLKAREWAGIYARAEALANPPSAPPPDYTPAPSKPEPCQHNRVSVWNEGEPGNTRYYCENCRTHLSGVSESKAKPESVESKPAYTIGVDPAAPGGDRTVTREVMRFGKPGDPIICTFHLEGDRLVEWVIVNQDEAARNTDPDYISPLVIGPGVSSKGCPQAYSGELFLRGYQTSEDRKYAMHGVNTRADVLRWGASIDQYNAAHTPAPSPVEGERAVRYDATGYPSSMGMYVLYVDHKKLTASLRSSLAAARAEVEAYKRAKSENDERFMIERDEARAEAGRAQDRALEAEREASGLASDLAALKLRVERADALAENVQRCQRAEGPCPVCKAAAADYLAVVPTVEKGAGK